MKGLKFRANMANYFSDCPELSRMIEKMELTRRDLVAIIGFYNSKCTIN
ncbi:MAG: hypothetical protein ACJAV5_000743 [Vicingaceae bacterium]